MPVVKNETGDKEITLEINQIHSNFWQDRTSDCATSRNEADLLQALELLGSDQSVTVPLTFSASSAGPLSGLGLGHLEQESTTNKQINNISPGPL